MKTSQHCQPKVVLVVNGRVCKTKMAATRRLADASVDKIIQTLLKAWKGTPRDLTGNWKAQRLLSNKFRKDKRLKRVCSYHTSKWMKS